MSTGQFPKRRDTDSQVEFRREAAGLQEKEREKLRELPPIALMNRAERRRIGLYSRRFR